ncbi:MAG: hypothetical protein MJ246_06265 [Clostridia bacterium]|nr:hypothetical protein [Clostridia bacterium]
MDLIIVLSLVSLPFIISDAKADEREHQKRLAERRNRKMASQMKNAYNYNKAQFGMKRV